MVEFRPSQITGDIQVVNKKISIRPTATIAAVSAATLTTILTFTATIATFVKNIRLSGELPCRVDFVFNTVFQEAQRLTGSRGVEFWFDAPFPMAIGDVIDMKVFHNFTGATSRYDCTLYGFPE